jgi:hypothetical protein
MCVWRDGGIFVQALDSQNLGSGCWRLGLVFSHSLLWHASQKNSGQFGTVINTLAGRQDR